MKVKFSDDFLVAYKRLKKRYKSMQTDFEALLYSLQENPNQGVELIDDLRKIRLAISSKGRGKSGGARVIVRVRMINDELHFIYIYDKSDYANVSDSFLKDVLKRM